MSKLFCDWFAVHYVSLYIIYILNLYIFSAVREPWRLSEYSIAGPGPYRLLICSAFIVFWVGYLLNFLVINYDVSN